MNEWDHQLKASLNTPKNNLSLIRSVCRRFVSRHSYAIIYTSYYINISIINLNRFWFNRPATHTHIYIYTYTKIHTHTHTYNYIPIGSMYAIYGNIYHQYTPNVSIYTIHGSYGIYIIIRISETEQTEP